MTDPPLSAGQKVGYRTLMAAAIETMPDRIVELLELPRYPAGGVVGGRALGVLRWALGSSPSWHVALIRSGAPIPTGLFKQRPAVEPDEALGA